MKNAELDRRSNTSGQGLVIVIILLAIIAGGAWWLFNNKQTMDREARAFGREMIQRLTVNHDAAFFANHLSPQAKLDNPRSKQEYIMSKLQELGAPAQPIQIDESITWESHFFEPRGFFTAHLIYPAQTATLQIAVSHPVSKWQLDDITMTWNQPR
jgi:PIN domain nuclease of toxin-antitoxin system